MKVSRILININKKFLIIIISKFKFRNKQFHNTQIGITEFVLTMHKLKYVYLVSEHKRRYSLNITLQQDISLMLMFVSFTVFRFSDVLN